MTYSDLISAINSVHENARAGVAGAVNRHLVLRNWLIGGYLVEFQQNGKDRAEYGTGLLKRISADLKKNEVAGCSAQMLERMRVFFRSYPQLAKIISSPPVRNSLMSDIPEEFWSKSSPVVRISEDNAESVPEPLPPEMILRLSWTHLVELLRISDPWKRAFYENECLAGNWSKRQLQRQIGSLLYERTGLSTGKQAVIEAARDQAADAPLDVSGLIRDPYVLEFAGLAEKPHYLEKELEKALLDHLQQFLIELGTGFCFEARQKRITVGTEDDYIDLVFYHRILRCHLLIDLKTRTFQHGDAGQMNFYLNYWKTEMMGEGDEPPVGLILCTDKKETRVDYATAGLDQNLFVSRYLVALPNPEEIQQLIENDRAVWEQQHGEEEKSEQ